jgi:hypothetical protein
MTNSSFRVILTRCWICVKIVFIFSTDSHFLWTVSKLFKVTIIHPRTRICFFGNLISTLSCYKRSLTSWHCLNSRSFRFIDSGTR